MKWFVSRPRQTAEDSVHSVTIEAQTLEDAIIGASAKLYDTPRPHVGQVYLVNLRVEVAQRPTLPLRSL